MEFERREIGSKDKEKEEVTQHQDSAGVEPVETTAAALQRLQGMRGEGDFRSPVERAGGSLPQTRETSGLGVTSPHDHETAQDDIERLRGRFDPETGTFPDDRRYEGREPKTVDREDPGDPR